MNNSSSSDSLRFLEFRLGELNTRRLILQEKTSRTISTFSDFQSIRKESIMRLSSKLEDQNRAAKERNLKIVEDVFKDKLLISGLINKSIKKVDSLSQIHSVGNNLSSSEKLYLAKKRFYQQIEISIPIWQKNKTNELEHKIKEVRLEKAASMQRRENLRLQLSKEDKVKYEFEQQRRELFLSLTLEHKEQLDSQAKQLVLKEEGKLVDIQVIRSLEEYNADLMSMVEQRLNNPHLENYVEIDFPKLFDPPKSPSRIIFKESINEMVTSSLPIEASSPSKPSLTSTVPSIVPSSPAKVIHEHKKPLHHIESTTSLPINDFNNKEEPPHYLFPTLPSDPISIPAGEREYLSIDVSSPLKDDEFDPVQMLSIASQSSTSKLLSPSPSPKKSSSLSVAEKEVVTSKSPNNKDDLSEQLEQFPPMSEYSMSDCMSALRKCFSQIESSILTCSITNVYPSSMDEISSHVSERELLRLLHDLVHQQEEMQPVGGKVLKSIGCLVFSIIDSKRELLVPK